MYITVSSSFLVLQLFSATAERGSCTSQSRVLLAAPMVAQRWYSLPILWWNILEIGMLEERTTIQVGNSSKTCEFSS